MLGSDDFIGNFISELAAIFQDDKDFFKKYHWRSLFFGKVVRFLPTALLKTRNHF